MITKVIVPIMVVLLLTGCAGGDYGQYAQAIKEQNITQQIRIEAQHRESEDRQIRHKERMMQFATDAMAAAAKSKSQTDDLMVPMMIMLMEDKWATTETLTAASRKTPKQQTMKAPETTSEMIQASTGLILGAVSLGTSAYTSGKAIDAVVDSAASAGVQYYVSGEGNTVTHDSNKSGTDNVVSAGGDVAINGGTVNDQTDNTTTDNTDVDDGNEELGMCTGERESVPITRVDESGTEWISAVCSCGSYQAGHCDA